MVYKCFVDENAIIYTHTFFNTYDYDKEYIPQMHMY